MKMFLRLELVKDNWKSMRAAGQRRSINSVITWTANKKSIKVNGQKIVDTGILYERALALVTIMGR